MHFAVNWSKRGGKGSPVEQSFRLDLRLPALRPDSIHSKISLDHVCTLSANEPLVPLPRVEIDQTALRILQPKCQARKAYLCLRSGPINQQHGIVVQTAAVAAAASGPGIVLPPMLLLRAIVVTRIQVLVVGIGGGGGGDFLLLKVRHSLQFVSVYAGK